MIRSGMMGKFCSDGLEEKKSEGSVESVRELPGIESGSLGRQEVCHFQGLQVFKTRR